MSGHMMRIALVQVSYGEESSRSRQDYVHAVARRVIERLRGECVDLVVFPELWSTGAFRPKQWQERAETLDGPTVSVMAQVARETGAVIHVGSIIERDADDLHNTAVLLDAQGEVITTYRKIHRFAAGGLEAELLDPGTQISVVDLPLRDGGTVRTGLSTCYDLRFPELYRAQVDDGAEVFVVPASWPDARIDVWDLLLRARAVENRAVVIGVNATGLDGKTQMGGRSVVLDPAGEQLAAMGAGDETVILTAEIDLAAAREARESFPVLEDRRIDVGRVRD